MSDAEFLMTFPCYLIGRIDRGQVATRKIGGEQTVLIFSDEPLAEGYLADTPDLPPDFSPIQLDESQFHRQLQLMQPKHCQIAVDLNHKTGIARVFKIDDVLARWDA